MRDMPADNALSHYGTGLAQAAEGLTTMSSILNCDGVA
jgi:hypothetical protein